jgi:very-short-patch-repair endonuclease
MASPAAQRRRRATQEANEFDGVLSRRRLLALGIHRNAVAREVAADRWRTHGSRTVALHTRPLSDVATRWRAIWEVGEEMAALDGVSALAAVGLQGLSQGVTFVSVPQDVHLRNVAGVRQVRLRRQEHEVLTAGVPRVRPAIATLRAASWAGSDRQAALFLVMPIQQRIVHPDHLRAALATTPLRGRRGLIRQLVADICDGAHSLGELDFATACRRRGLPTPDRQFLRETPTGRVYLDVRWSEIGLVVEIDGSGHRMHLSVTDDNLRQNAAVIDGNTVLRIDLVGLRVKQDLFMDQVCAAHAALTRRSVA